MNPAELSPVLDLGALCFVAIPFLIIAMGIAAKCHFDKKKLTNPQNQPSTTSKPIVSK